MRGHLPSEPRVVRRCRRYGELPLIEVDGWGTGNHQAGPLPRTLLGKKPHFMCHPLVPERDRLLAITVHTLGHVASDPPPLGLLKVRLHPDRGINEVLELALACANALDDDQVRLRGNLDHAFASMQPPRRRLKPHTLPTVQCHQDLVAQQMPPGEERLMPGQVIRVDDRRTGDGPLQLSSQRRLT